MSSPIFAQDSVGNLLAPLVDSSRRLVTVNGATGATDANGAVVQSSLTANRWSYAAAAGGISNTAVAVTIAAAVAGKRNYLRSMYLTSEALGAATEFCVRDGAGGAVLMRSKIGTAGIVNGINLAFDPPLKGSVNTLLEIVTLTASLTGAVHVNAQGFTGD